MTESTEGVNPDLRLPTRDEVLADLTGILTASIDVDLVAAHATALDLDKIAEYLWDGPVGSLFNAAYGWRDRAYERRRAFHDLATRTAMARDLLAGVVTPAEIDALIAAAKNGQTP